MDGEDWEAEDAEPAARPGETIMEAINKRARVASPVWPKR